MGEVPGRGRRPTPEPSPGAAGGDGARVRAITAQFKVALGRPEPVATAVAGLLEGEGALAPDRQVILLGLVPLLRERTGPVAEVLFNGMVRALDRMEDPLPLLVGLFHARSPDLLGRALDVTERLAEEKTLLPDRSMAAAFAERFEEGELFWEMPETLERVARLIETAPDVPLWTGFFHDPTDPRLARFAARVLDRHGEPAPAETARRILGEEAYAFLAPYLAYTRAGHADLLALAPRPGTPPPALPSLRRTQERCGENALREIVARLGWPAVNLGVEAQPVWEISMGGAYPYRVAPELAPVLERVGDARKVGEAILVTAHGGTPEPGREAPAEEDPVGRFRSMNLVHAEILAEILDVSPLTPEKVRRVLAGMDRVVADFVQVFGPHAADETAELPVLYAGLKERIEAELRREASTTQLSAELTRLVQAFEDPGSLAEVRTLHGLKRYLHQRGLRLGFRLVETGRATNRSVRVLVLRPRWDSPPPVVIRYVDFEPGEDDPGAVPYPVRVLAEGLGRQILSGKCEFPEVKIFCYGNEVHYYLAFGTHPAFLRVDYAPPLRGGMIDLEYYGVSKVDLATHPEPGLPSIRCFLERLDFDVRIDGTRIHARYDKERALDLGELCGHTEALFRLLPHLMDVDWTIGSLRLPPAARCAVAEAWADFFLRWGALPVERFLTRDRLGVSTGLVTGPAGEREARWEGEGPYRDRYRPPPPTRDFLSLAKSLGIPEEAAAELESAGSEPMGQLALERLLLEPLEKIRPEPTPGAPPTPEPPLHEAERFARILAGGSEPTAAAVRAAALVGPIERNLRFRITGAVRGFPVERATLPLRGARLTVFVLRDATGVVRLAFVSEAGLDIVRLAALLRRNSYPVPEADVGASEARTEALEVLEAVRGAARLPHLHPLPGERVVTGLRASPGRVVGRAILDPAGRVPESVRGAVLVAPSVRPEDTVLLYHAAGVVSTGGGILSHAGLTAVQFHKPALVIDGAWETQPDAARALRYRVTSWRPEVREVAGFEIEMRRDLRESEYLLVEGDLVVVDAGVGTMRVLGQDREALALTEDLAELGEAHRLLSGAGDEREILALRGRRLRARHQLQKLLGRIRDPILARHAVEEILNGRALAAGGAAREEKGTLLAALLGNPAAGGAAREALSALSRGLERRLALRAAEAMQRLPTADTLFEVLSVRLALVRLQTAVDEARTALADCGFRPETAETGFDPAAFDLAARRELLRIRCGLVGAGGAYGAGPQLRHRLRRLRRLDAVLETPEIEQRDVAALDRALALRDRSARLRRQERAVLVSAECGFEMHPLIGWKAANLAEVERLQGASHVPPWFVVTHGAFEEMLRSPVPREAGGDAAPGPLGEAIAAVLDRDGLSPAQKSVHIRDLWEKAVLPPSLVREVTAAYRALAEAPPVAGAAGPQPGGGHAPPYVAVRSSAREEDAEAAARAGEFDTFLYVRGGESVLDFLKRAWSGLWTERAVHSRSVFGTGMEEVGGGVIVQRIAHARVAGVLQTVNVAEDEHREMVLNAGLGLGEGVVSGTVGADHVVVRKEGDLERAPLRFRYVTADKRERVVFDERTGFGTVRVESLYHQRLRPALEYVELRELVLIARRLEEAYGYPLDLEFAVEGSHIWILQVRPVATFLTALHETLERRPLGPAAVLKETTP
jgi:pyruvate,water dikinase